MLENGQITTLNLNSILPNRFQPRLHFDEQKLNDLAESIRRYGVIQPIVVRQIGNKYEIIAGERRYKASKLANKESIPAIILNLSDRDSEEIALLENIQREDLTPIEEAVSYKRILDIGYITQEKLAKQLGKSQSSIANKIRLLNLDDSVQDALLHGKISERHARSLLRLPNKSLQQSLLDKIINERLTVKLTDNEIDKILASNENSNIKTSGIFTAGEEIEQLTLDTPKRGAVPVASHRIIRGKQLEEKKEGTFMDIDKIMAEAKDINAAPEEKPVNDIADLMSQDPMMANASTESVPVSNPETNVNSNNKFVTFNPNMQVEQTNTFNAPSNAPVQPEVPFNAPSNEPMQPEVTFDSMFNTTPSDLQTTSLDNNMMQSDNSSFVEPTPMPSTPLMQMETPQVIPSAPVMTSPEPVSNGLQPNIPYDQQNITMPQESFGSNDMSMPAQNNDLLQPNVPNMSAPDVSFTPQMDNNLANNPLFGMPVNDVNSDPSVNLMAPQVDIPQNIQVPSDQNFEQAPAVMNIDVPDSEIIEDQNQVSIMNNMPGNMAQNGDNGNFENVINLIKNCASEIEKMGYLVNLDEINMGDNYQVTFRINK